MTTDLGFGQIVFDCVRANQLADFWSALLELPVRDGANPYFAVIEGSSDRSFPSLMFIAVPEPRQGKNRLHLDRLVAGRPVADHAAPLDVEGLPSALHRPQRPMGTAVRRRSKPVRHRIGTGTPLPLPRTVDPPALDPAPTTPDDSDRGEPAAVKAARRVRRAAWGNGPAATLVPRPRPTQLLAKRVMGPFSPLGALSESSADLHGREKQRHRCCTSLLCCPGLATWSSRNAGVTIESWHAPLACWPSRCCSAQQPVRPRRHNRPHRAGRCPRQHSRPRRATRMIAARSTEDVAAAPSTKAVSPTLQR
jgi:Glyoxalase-like domain